MCVYVEHSLGEESKIHCEHSRLQITRRHLFIWKLKFVLSAFRSTCHTFTSWAVSWEWQCSMATTSMGALLYPSTNSCWVNPSPWMTWSLLILTCTTVLSGSCTYKSEQRSFSFHFLLWFLDHYNTSLTILFPLCQYMLCKGVGWGGITVFTSSNFDDSAPYGLKPVFTSVVC